MAALGRSTQYDFYLLPEYHALAEEQGEGDARLFVYTQDEYTLALPLLLRSLEGVPGFNGKGKGWKDATSVYGYAGPVASRADVPAEVIRRFQAAVHGQLRELGVVSVFSRLHPLLPQAHLLAGLGECKTLARTVSIDLTRPPEVQRSLYRKNHREGVNRLRRSGISCDRDDSPEALDEFVALYHETMRRVGAADAYFFPRSYFDNLRRRLGPRVNLFVCRREGRIISGGIYIECDGIVQYHLGGTLTEHLKLAPMKLLTDEVRLWGTAQGLKTFHLGGGATSQPDDSLLHFKMGFSDCLHQFAVWRWVLYPEVYQQLCQDRGRWNDSHGLRPALPEYFPEYRTPTVPVTP
jgi:hypothetical protein